MLLDADYNGGVRTLTFQAGSTSATTSISTVDDDIQEGVERFTAELFNPQNGLSVGLSSTATIDITDNDGKKNTERNRRKKSIIITC